MNIKARSLKTDEEEELDRYLLSGLELLPVQNQMESHFLILAIQLVLEAIRMGEKLPQDISMEEFCTQLGIVYGEQICLFYGWDWIKLDIEGKYDGIAVANSERTQALFPIPSIHRWMNPKNQNRSLSLFEEIGSLAERDFLQILH